jgi:hypothetical protein
MRGTTAGGLGDSVLAPNQVAGTFKAISGVDGK